jgi:hypothetical protein
MAKGAAVAAVLASVIFVLILLAFVVYTGRPSSAPEGNGARLAAPLTVGLSRDSYRAGYWAPLRVGGRDWSALVDTGSPYLVVPHSLPCAGAAACRPTGQELTLRYGDGTTDSASFELSPFRLGGARFPGVIFGGNEEGGEGSPTADDVILGLSSPPPRSGAPPPLIAQMNIQLMEFDFTREASATMVLSPPGAKEGGGALLASGALLAPGALRAAGYPLVADLYVIALDPARNAAEGLPPLEFLLLDTGTTLTLLPPPLASPPSGFILHLAGGGNIPVRGSDVGALPADLGKERGVGLAILGNRSMSGFRLAIDLGARRFSFRARA